DLRSRAGTATEGGPFLRRAELQMRISIICHTANMFAHEQRKKGIHKIQHRLVTAKIMRQRNRPAGPCVFAPQFFIGLKYFWVREAKAVNALFHIPDQKSISLVVVATDRAKNG